VELTKSKRIFIKEFLRMTGILAYSFKYIPLVNLSAFYLRVSKKKKTLPIVAGSGASSKLVSTMKLVTNSSVQALHQKNRYIAFGIKTLGLSKLLSQQLFASLVYAI
jgi:hypothetical protein